MPQIDLTITISVIVALAAIVSPMLTALINNHHQLKIKKIELTQQEYEQTVLYKRNIFENYLKSLSLISRNASWENIDSYSKYYPLAYMYFPKEIQEKMAIVNQLITQHEYRKAIPYIDELAILINTELQKL